MRRGLGVSALTALVVVCALAALGVSPAHGSGLGSCTQSQQLTAQAALSKYLSTAAAKRRAYFAKHTSKSLRAAYDKQQKAILLRLRTAANCTVQAPPTTTTPVPVEACTPTIDGSGNPTNSVGPFRAAGVTPIGTLNAAMLFVDFPDAVATQTTQELYDLLAPGAMQYYNTQSYGRLKLNITQIPHWYRMSKPNGDYGFGGRGVSFDQQHAYMQEAVTLADADVDFSKYQLVYVVAPKTATTIVYSPAFDPNHTPGDGGVFGLKADGNVIDAGATFGTDIYTSRRGWQTLAHETGHAFGMPDYYDIPNFDPNNYQQQFHYAGGWTIMSWSEVGAEWFAWDRYRAGWIDPSQIRCQDTAGSTTQTITPVEASGGLKMLVAKISPSVAYAVEDRSQTAGDAGLCSSGVLVYRLDAQKLSGQGPLQIETTRNGSDSTKVAQCGILYDAPLQAGESWEDSSVKVEVLAANSDGSYQVRLTHK